MPAARREEVDIIKLVEQSGVVLKRAGKEWKGLCPFHAEDTGSFSVNREKGVFFCFGCGAKGNAKTFAQRMNGSIVTGNDLLKKVAHPAKRIPATNTNGTDRGEIIENVLRRYQLNLSKSRTAMEYLKSRGLANMELLRQYRVGYSDGAVKDSAPANSTPGQILREFGYINERGKEHFTGCIVWPIMDAAGAVVGMYGRRVAGRQGAPKHLYLPGPHRGIWNREGARSASISGEPVVICECVIDAHTCAAAGIHGAIALYGAHGLTDEHVELLEELRPRIVLMLDADQGGRDGTEKAIERFAPLGLAISVANLPDGLDVNEVFTTTGAEVLRTAIANATPIEKPEPTPSTSSDVPAAQLVESAGGNLQYVLETRTYHIRNFSVFGFARLRATILLARHDDGLTFVDTLDLYSNRARSAFVAAAAVRLAVSAEEIESDLLGMVLLLDEYRQQKAEKFQGKEQEKKHVMTPEERMRGMMFLTSADLLAELVADCEIAGYIGEEKNKALSYLIATSRKMGDPLSAILIAGSGAGKSALMDVIEEMMPPEDVYAVSDLTDQALFYMGHDELSHKLLIVAERSGSEDADYSLRELQTKRVLRKGVAIKDQETGRIKTIRIEVRGPVAVMESTTNPRMNPENANRCFVLHVDESVDQTRAIQIAQRRARTLFGIEADVARNEVIEKHRSAQRLLEPVRVVIPFAEQITFPVESVRNRRDHSRFLNLIEAVAFLHQKRRTICEKSGTRYIEATLDDYETARRLTLEVLAANLDEIPRASRTLLEAIEAVADQRGDRQKAIFSRRDLMEATSWTYDRVRGAIGPLIENETLLFERGSRGTALYRLGAPLARPEIMLPERTQFEKEAAS